MLNFHFDRIFARFCRNSARFWQNSAEIRQYFFGILRLSSDDFCRNSMHFLKVIADAGRQTIDAGRPPHYCCLYQLIAASYSPTGESRLVESVAFEECIEEMN